MEVPYKLDYVILHMIFQEYTFPTIHIVVTVISEYSYDHPGKIKTRNHETSKDPDLLCTF